MSRLGKHAMILPCSRGVSFKTMQRSWSRSPSCPGRMNHLSGHQRVKKPSRPSRPITSPHLSSSRSTSCWISTSIGMHSTKPSLPCRPRIRHIESTNRSPTRLDSYTRRRKTIQQQNKRLSPWYIM